MAEKEKKKNKYEIVEVATQTAPVIKDNVSGETYDLLAIICAMANDIAELKKNLS